MAVFKNMYLRNKKKDVSLKLLVCILHGISKIKYYYKLQYTKRRTEKHKKFTKDTNKCYDNKYCDFIE